MKVKRTAEEISKRLQQLREVGIARLRDVDLVLDAATTAAAHGLRALKVPLTVPDAAPAGADAVVGAGTVRTVAQLKDAMRAGAEFLVAPGLNRSMVRAAGPAGTLYVPGVYTASEVDLALGLGLRLLKLFPAVLAGPAYLAALRQPFPEARFMPTGGIGPQNAAAFLRAGAAVLRLGSSIFPAERIDGEGTAIVGNLTRATLAAVSNLPA